jgi:hypothetical protein
MRATAMSGSPIRIMGDGEIPVVLIPGWVSNIDLYDDPTSI